MDIKAKKYKKVEIKDIAAKHFEKWACEIPVRPDYILEVVFGVDIIPSLGLKDRLMQYSEQEAFLSNHGKEIYIDDFIYNNNSTNR